MNKDLKDKTLDELEQIVVSMRQKKYLAKYIFRFIHVKNATEISQITPLSQVFRRQLARQGCYISRLNIRKKLTDKDGTIKYAFELNDGKQIEAVLLFDDSRRTLCVSTQVGCALGCRFCATAELGFSKNLTAGEIIDQINTIEALNGCDARLVERRTLNATDMSCANNRRDTRVTNVVYMGMGEPLLNYENVIKSVRILNHPAGRNIGIRHLTISTCGIAPAIRKLADEDIHPRLAVSLNAITDTLRTRLMSINDKYSIAELLSAIKAYQQKVKQRVTFEYVMIKGLNDSVNCAEMLVKRLGDIWCNVNLIEYNPHPHCEFVASDRASIKRFVRLLQRANIETTVRFKRGQSINAACGQLGAGWIDNQPNGLGSL